MGKSYERVNGNGLTDNDPKTLVNSSYKPTIKGSYSSLPWLDLKVFYVGISKCEIDTPEYLKVVHVPLNSNTLLEVNGVRTSIYSGGESTILKRDRLTNKCEKVTFVSTNSIRMSGSVKFEVFDKDVSLLTGILEMSNSTTNCLNGESRNNRQRWRMSCESKITAGTGFLKGSSTIIEVCIAGCFYGNPIILTKTLHISCRKKQRKGILDSIPEYEPTETCKEVASGSGQVEEHSTFNTEKEEDHSDTYEGMDYLEDEDGELTWFNAGVRVGVAIGLSVCLGVGIGVGLLVRTYQGATCNFRRRLL